MAAATMPAQVIELSPERLDDAAHVLARAFVHYPLMRYILADRGARYDRALEALFRLSCARRLAHGGALLGAIHGSELVGVAGIGMAGHPAPPSLESADQWTTLIGARAASLFERHGRLVDKHRPRQPHFVLDVLGVLAGRRRQGYGHALLARVHALSAAHPTSQGIYPDTEHPANVSLYAHFGYRVVGCERLGPVSIWCMFRPNGVEQDDNMGEEDRSSRLRLSRSR